MNWMISTKSLHRDMRVSPKIHLSFTVSWWCVVFHEEKTKLNKISKTLLSIRTDRMTWWYDSSFKLNLSNFSIRSLFPHPPTSYHVPFKTISEIAPQSCLSLPGVFRFCETSKVPIWKRQFWTFLANFQFTLRCSVQLQIWSNSPIFECFGKRLSDSDHFFICCPFRILSGGLRILKYFHKSVDYVLLLLKSILRDSQEVVVSNQFNCLIVKLDHPKWTWTENMFQTTTGAEIETMIEEVSNSQRQVLDLCKEHRSAAWLKTKLACWFCNLYDSGC